MENLNLLGIAVKSYAEAIAKLGTTNNEIVLHKSELIVHDFTFIITTYTAETSKDFCYAVEAVNLRSNQYDE